MGSRWAAGPWPGSQPRSWTQVCTPAQAVCSEGSGDDSACALSVSGGGGGNSALTQGTSEERLSTCPPLSLARPHGLSGRPCQLHPHSHESYTHNGGSPGDATSHPHGAQSRVSPCPNSEKSGPPRRAVWNGTLRPADSAEQGSPATHRTLRAAVGAWVSAWPSPY